MIDLVERQRVAYPNHTVAARLGQVDLTPTSYNRLLQGARERKVRESAIPDEDVEAVVNLFIEHPDLGAERARLTLINAEEAYMSTANINTIKGTLARTAMEEYKRRKEEEKQLEAQLKADLAERGNRSYTHERATEPNDIWAIDFVNITFVGMAFALCVVYDEYSQYYTAVGVGDGADHDLAAASLTAGVENAGTMPRRVRRDNGSPFLTVEYQHILEGAEDYPTPTGSPWFNGSLESSNRSLKSAVRVAGMQEMATETKVYRQSRLSRVEALETLQRLVGKVRLTLNGKIARPKHKLTPEQVYTRKEMPAAEKNKAFIARKQKDRTERMAEIRTNPNKRKPRTLKSKIQAAIGRALRKLNTNTLFILDEALHQRFRMFET